MKIFFLLSLPLYALDQVTKYLVLRFIDPSDPRDVIPGFFTLVHVTNTGAAFGSFFYNLIDERGESYMLHTLSGAPREAFVSEGAACSPYLTG